LFKIILSKRYLKHSCVYKALLYDFFKRQIFPKRRLTRPTRRRPRRAAGGKESGKERGVMLLASLGYFTPVKRSGMMSGIIVWNVSIAFLSSRTDAAKQQSDGRLNVAPIERTGA